MGSFNLKTYLLSSGTFFSIISSIICTLSFFSILFFCMPFNQMLDTYIYVFFLLVLFMYEYLFCILSCNPILLYFVVQMDPALAIGNSFSWLLCLFDIAPSLSLCVCVCVCVLSDSFLSGTIKYSRLILYIFCLSPRIRHFSGDPWFLLLENGIGNHDLGTSRACCFWGVAASRPSQQELRQSKDINVCIPPHVYNHISKYFSV